MTAVVHSMASRGFTAHLGVEVVEATAESVVLDLPVTPDLLQPHGILHGGVHCSLVETAASFGASLWWGERGPVVGVSNQTDFLRAVKDGRLTARAEPVHQGRLQQLWQVLVTDDRERTVARGQVRLQNLGSEGQEAAGA
jgi:1,4-dihydroxy-2-naphthoyl-CoA hydrolase